MVVSQSSRSGVLDMSWARQIAPAAFVRRGAKYGRQGEVPVRKGRFSEAQIVGILKEHDAGVPTAELARKHGIRANDLRLWNAKYEAWTGPNLYD